jgi:hypothetical protein
LPEGLDHALMEILNDQATFILRFRIHPDFHIVEHTTGKVNPSYCIHIFLL